MITVDFILINLLFIRFVFIVKRITNNEYTVFKSDSAVRQYFHEQFLYCIGYTV